MITSDASLAALLSEVKAALQQATPGPWSVTPHSKSAYGIPIHGPFGASERRDEAPHVGNIFGSANATLIAKTPEMLGALVQAVEDQQRQLENRQRAVELVGADRDRARESAEHWEHLTTQANGKLGSLEAEVAGLRADGQRLAWLREHYFGANFRYGEPEEAVLVFGPLPKSARITGDFDADIGALIPPRSQ